MSGSSPLTRGTHTKRNTFFTHCRFIPAYAGNSLAIHSVASAPSVHPRLRGELFKLSDNLAWCFGSSPLTRGTLRRGSRQAQTRAVHPRLRGELYLARLQQISYCGSSPLTRGTQWTSCTSYVYHRFIPAYAGNSTPQNY